MTSPSLFDRATDHMIALQESILAAVEELEGGATFRRDDWQREEGGEGDASNPAAPILRGWGRTRVIENGRFFERGGVNLSVVEGRFGSVAPTHMPGDGHHFRAVGVSLVLHPHNPFAPTVHMNYRRMERGSTGWFGGGADLTPNYLFEEDARHFHQTHKAVCDAHPAVANHTAMKEECDRYFTIPHRGEMRGVGGIFFDHMMTQPEESFAFLRDASQAFIPAYLPLARRRDNTPFEPHHRQWQLLRRGRYVEFNLVNDRGTQFGLRTGGRIESILMSMPANASWAYDHHPAPGSDEARMVAALQPRDWTA